MKSRNHKGHKRDNYIDQGIFTQAINFEPSSLSKSSSSLDYNESKEEEEETISVPSPVSEKPSASIGVIDFGILTWMLEYAADRNYFKVLDALYQMLSGLPDGISHLPKTVSEKVTIANEIRKRMDKENAYFLETMDDKENKSILGALEERKRKLGISYLIKHALSLIEKSETHSEDKSDESNENEIIFAESQKNSSAENKRENTKIKDVFNSEDKYEASKSDSSIVNKGGQLKDTKSSAYPKEMTKKSFVELREQLLDADKTDNQNECNPSTHFLPQSKNGKNVDCTQALKNDTASFEESRNKRQLENHSNESEHEKRDFENFSKSEESSSSDIEIMTQFYKQTSLKSKAEERERKRKREEDREARRVKKEERRHETEIMRENMKKWTAKERANENEKRDESHESEKQTQIEEHDDALIAFNGKILTEGESNSTNPSSRQNVICQNDSFEDEFVPTKKKNITTFSHSGKDDDLDDSFTKEIELKYYKVKRRNIQRWEDWEVDNLKEGVKQHGRRWETILAKYKFNKVRTAVDLKDKWRLVMKSEQKKATSVL